METSTRILKKLALLAACAGIVQSTLGCTKSDSQPSNASTQRSASPKSQTDAGIVVAQEAVPTFDIAELQKHAYLQPDGERVLILRGGHVEMKTANLDASGKAKVSEIIQGSAAKITGSTLTFSMADGGSRVLTISERAQKLSSQSPSAVFVAQESLSPDGRSYTANTGDTVTFKGNKATFASASKKAVTVVSDVQYNGNALTYTQTQPKKVARILVVENGGYRLVDVTAGEILVMYTLNEAN